MAISLEKEINTFFNSYGSSINRFKVDISVSTGRTTISNSSSKFSINTIKKNTDNLNYDFICSPYIKPINDNAQLKNSLTTSQFTGTLGYFLGYRKTTYSGNNSYTSEGVFDNKYSSYLYFALNDYTGSQTASNTYALFQNSIIADQILAVIPLNGLRFNYIYDNGSNFIYKKREYFGPVDISKISIKLLNQIGELVNLLDSEFSFSLEVTRVYDLNKPYNTLSNLEVFSNNL